MTSSKLPLDDTPWVGGPSSKNGKTAHELVEAVYDELHQLAATAMRSEQGNHTLQATAIVHEVFLALADRGQFECHGRSHFRALAATLIRRILVDHARRVRGHKRGGGWSRVTLDESSLGVEVDLSQLVSLDDALEQLHLLQERQARVVELRYYGGLSIDETATELGVSPRTVDGDWRMARAWLRRELGSDEVGR